MKRLPSQFAVSSSLLCQPFPNYNRAPGASLARQSTAPVATPAAAPAAASTEAPAGDQPRPPADAPSRGLSPLPPSLESSDVGTVTVGYVP